MTYLRWWTLEGSEMAVFVVAYARCPGVCVCVCAYTFSMIVCNLCSLIPISLPSV